MYNHETRWVILKTKWTCKQQEFFFPKVYFAQLFQAFKESAFHLVQMDSTDKETFNLFYVTPYN